MDPRLRLALSLVALLAVFGVSSIGYHVISGAGAADSAYMAVITLSTVGYAEIIEPTRAVRLWTCLTILVGIGSVSVAFTSLFTVLLSGDLRRLRGRTRMQTRINHLSRHVIICGAGRMGFLTAADLRRRKVPFVVVEQDSAIIRELSERGDLYVEGDATAEEKLRDAGIGRARALVAVLPRDSDNLYVALTARGMRADLLIVARAEHPAAEVKLKRAGADRVILPHIAGATRIANILTRPGVVDFFDAAVEGVDLEVDQYVIGERSSINGKTLRGSGIRQEAGMIVVAIKKADGARLFSPAPDQIIECGDTLIMVGEAGASDRLGRLGL